MSLQVMSRIADFVQAAACAVVVYGLWRMYREIRDEQDRKWKEREHEEVR